MTENELLEEEKKKLFSINIFCKTQEKMQGGISKWLLTDKEIAEFKISAIEDLIQYRSLGTVEEIRSKMEELARWHSDRLNSRIKNEFAAMSTLICHNCDHKDEYIEELEAEIEEYRAIGTVEEIQERLERLQKWHDEHLEDITVDLAEYRELCKVEEISHMKSLKRIIQRNGTLGKALEEGTEYEAIGTVEECRAAVEKQKAKKPKDRYKTTHIWDSAYCPVCGCGITARWSFCQSCGRAIDWSDSP